MTRIEEIRLCGKTKKEVKATNHCRAYFEDTNTQGILICEIDNIMTSGIPFTDEYVELLAEKICKIINEDLKNGVTGRNIGWNRDDY